MPGARPGPSARIGFGMSFGASAVSSQPALRSLPRAVTLQRALDLGHDRRLGLGERAAADRAAGRLRVTAAAPARRDARQVDPAVRAHADPYAVRRQLLEDQRRRDVARVGEELDQAVDLL